MNSVMQSPPVNGSRLQVTGLQKAYGLRQVVKDVSLEVESGEVVGLLGPNGAGKTTTLRVLAGILKPSSGRVALGGHNIVTQPIDAERVSIYNERVHAKFPLLGLKLKNSTDLHLTQGPITVFEGSSYAGDAQIRNPLPEMLEAVAQQGSISAAARTLGMSYRHVWGALKHWQEVMGEPLVTWSQGQPARLTRPMGQRDGDSDRLKGLSIK